MRIARIDEADAQRWDEYVAPRTGTVTDLYAWRRMVQRAYGIRAHFLAALDADRIVGTLGLFEITHPFFGHYLSTAVFGNDGGLHYDTPESRDALIAEARQLTKTLGVGYLAIRGRGVGLDGFHDDAQFSSAVIDLEGGADAVWNRLPSKTRNQVRRGQKEGFSLRSGADQVDAFYDVFHRHMRDLGSPAHGRDFYGAVTEQFGERAEFLVVRDGDQLVAGALLFRHRGTATNYHTVALHRYNRRCANYLLYWAMIESSAKRGDRWFDLGRSRVGSSQLAFKENWGPEIVPLHYNYFLGTAARVPNLNPANPAFRLQIAVWQHLPLFVTKRLGPRLISGLA